MPWKKGQSGNPKGPRVMHDGPYNLPALARTYTAQAIKRLGQILEDENAPPNVVLKAVEIVFDRGYGKPVQAVEVSTDHKPLVELTDAALLAIASGAGTVASQASAGKPH